MIAYSKEDTRMESYRSAYAFAKLLIISKINHIKSNITIFYYDILCVYI